MLSCNMKPLHDSLRVLHSMNSQAEIRLDGKQLYWKDGEKENSITFFEDDELPDVRKMVWGANDIFLHGNLRFSSTSC